MSRRRRWLQRYLDLFVMGCASPRIHIPHVDRLDRVRRVLAATEITELEEADVPFVTCLGAKHSTERVWSASGCPGGRETLHGAGGVRRRGVDRLEEGDHPGWATPDPTRPARIRRRDGGRIVGGYLGDQLGYSGTRIGVIVTGVAGLAVLPMLTGTWGWRFQRRLLLRAGALSMVATGLVFATSTAFLCCWRSG